MARRGRRKSKKTESSFELNWQFGSEIPVYDIFKYFDVGNYDRALNDLVNDIASGYYLLWEAVMSQEQNLPLTKAHRKALKDLLYFGEDEKDQILYIDGIPRPKEPWYEIARKILSNVIDEPFDTTEGISPAVYEGWPMLIEVLGKHGATLSLPTKVEKPIDIFPEELQHLMQLYQCFEALSGLGQDDELTLENPEQREYRIKWFLRCIKESKETIQFFDLSLETLLERIIMPSKDEKIFKQLMMSELKLPSSQARLVDFL